MARTMLSTTLAVAISSNQVYVPLASTTSISPGTLCFCDREAFTVLTTPVAGTIPNAARGSQGTASTAHQVGATVYYGPANAFGIVDPSGKIPSTPDIYLPFVVIPTGNVFNDDGSGNWTKTSGGGGSLGPSGTALLNFPSIADGEMAELTFTLASAAVGNRVIPAWPSTLAAGLQGVMFVSALNTISVRLTNLSGAAIDPPALTFGAQVAQ